MRISGHCQLCGSETLEGHGCRQEYCLGKSDEWWAIEEAEQAFARSAITVAELERRVEVALTNPPRHDRGGFVLLYR